MPQTDRSIIHSILLYLITEDWFFCSHFLPIARQAQRMGFKIKVATRVGVHRDQIEAEGFEVIPLKWQRRQGNIFRLLAEFIEIFRLYRALRPDIVHHIAWKAILLGGAASRLAGVSRRIYAITGLGSLFLATGPRAWIERRVLRPVLALIMRGQNTRILVETDELGIILTALGLARPQALRMIPGAGIDLTKFSPLPEPVFATPHQISIAMVSRMLRDKGVVELIEAGKLLTARGYHITIELVGPLDPDNQSAISEAELHALLTASPCQWLGATNNIAAVWRRAAIAVLPSYSEGLPKALLEAAACSRPMVATDEPGCRAIVIDGVTGLLVPARNFVLLADALEKMIIDPELRQKLGAAARARVVAEFSEEAVVSAIAAVYREMQPRAALEG